MNEQNDYKAQYFSDKANVEAIKQSIAEKDAEIKTTKQLISDTKSQIDTISKQLEIDEFRFNRNSQVMKPSMSLDEFREQKRVVAELKEKLTLLNDDLDYLTKFMNGLRSDLSRSVSQLRSTKDRIVEEMVEQMADELVAVAGYQLKQLVMAIIAKNDKQKGFTLDEKSYFKHATNNDISNAICKRIFGNNDLPELHEAYQHIDALIDKAA